MLTNLAWHHKFDQICGPLTSCQSMLYCSNIFCFLNPDAASPNWSLQKDSIADISIMIVASCLYLLPAQTGPVSESDVDSASRGGQRWRWRPQRGGNRLWVRLRLYIHIYPYIAQANLPHAGSVSNLPVDLAQARTWTTPAVAVREPTPSQVTYQYISMYFDYISLNIHRYTCTYQI
jgi:hypothetical protein